MISLSEPEAEVRKNAEALGFDLKQIAFLDLTPTSDFFTKVESYDIFLPAEVEREPTTRKIVSEVEKLKPTRVFIDSVTQLRYLSPDTFQFRRQMFSLARFLTEQGATVLFSSEGSAEAPDDDLQFLSDGVISLEFASEGRTIDVIKFRGSAFQSGRHSMRIGSRGIEVFPRLVPEAYRGEFVAEAIPSGVPELDALLHGGLERGTVTIISGPSGVGKTTAGLQFLKEAASRDERSVVYTFEEGRETLLQRSESIDIPVRALMERDTLSVVQVEPLRYTPDEFASMVRHEVEKRQTRIVMVDSVSGYRLSLGSADLASHLHALCRYLKNMGATTILINEVESITGEFRATEAGISYLADNIIQLLYLETAGQMRRAIGVLKKRTSSFEKALRELEITRHGVRVGEPLVGLRGILTGTPERAQPPRSDLV